MQYKYRCHNPKKYVTTLTSLMLMTLSLFPITASKANDVDEERKYQQVIEMYRDYAKKFPQVTDIPASEAIPLINSSETIFVDVRKAKEQEVSMIPGAVTREEFLNNLELYSNKRIIAYCTISYRSGKFASNMAKKGILITNLEAGLLGWVHKDGPLHRVNKETNKLHVYGKKWDLAPAEIETVR